MRFIEGATLAHYTGDRDAKRAEVADALAALRRRVPRAVDRAPPASCSSRGRGGGRRPRRRAHRAARATTTTCTCPTTSCCARSASSSSPAPTRRPPPSPARCTTSSAGCTTTPTTPSASAADRLFLQRCVHETIRLQPSSPIAMRWALEPMVRCRRRRAVPAGRQGGDRPAGRQPRPRACGVPTPTRLRPHPSGAPRGVPRGAVASGSGCTRASARTWRRASAFAADRDPADHLFGLVPIAVQWMMEPRRATRSRPSRRARSHQRARLLVDVPGPARVTWPHGPVRPELHPVAWRARRSGRPLGRLPRPRGAGRCSRARRRAGPEPETATAPRSALLPGGRLPARRGALRRAPPFMDLDLRLAAMDDARHRAPGAVAQPAHLLPPRRAPTAADAICRWHNDTLAALVAQAPDRLAGFAQIPIQAPDLAVAELRRAVDELGLVGPYLGTQVGRDLDDPALDELWSTCAELDVPVFLHPGVHGTDGPRSTTRLGRFDLDLTLGFLYEETVAVSPLIFGGRAAPPPAPRRLRQPRRRRQPWLRERWQRGVEAALGPRLAGPARRGGRAARCLWFDAHTGGPTSLAMLARRRGHRPPRLRHQPRRLGPDPRPAPRRRRPSRPPSTPTPDGCCAWTNRPPRDEPPLSSPTDLHRTVGSRGAAGAGAIR